MKGGAVVVCGSRSYAGNWPKVLYEGHPDFALMRSQRAAGIALLHGELDQLRSELEFSTLVYGDCPSGGDALAREWANDRGCYSFEYQANWSKHGRKAGVLRNSEMLLHPDIRIVVAAWDGRSPGTLDTITKATRAGYRVRILPVL